jgi:hypothetical protein
VLNPKCVYNVYIIIKANPFGQSQNAAVTANGPALYNVCPLQFIIIRTPSAATAADPAGRR